MLLVALMSAPATTAWAEDETIIYLHGYIIEIEGTQPVHERFGLYDFNGFVEALGSDGAFYLSRPEWLEPVLDWVAERG